MNKENNLKKILILATPLLLFALLVIPYSWVNQQYIVKWLGCGCPTVDVNGNTLVSDFNANDFTSLFWLIVSISATVISIFLSKRIPKEKIWLRAVYIVSIFVVSNVISYFLCQQMMWC